MDRRDAGAGVDADAGTGTADAFGEHAPGSGQGGLSVHALTCRRVANRHRLKGRFEGRLKRFFKGRNTTI